ILAPLQNFPYHVGPTAGGHNFFAGREESGTHRGHFLAAAAAAVALLQIADEGPIFERESEPGRELQFDRSRKIFTQTRVYLTLASAENFSRIHPAEGIDNAFDFAHRYEQIVAQLFAHVFGARDTDTMLG